MCISDDIVATCGTINLDYRSLYHHFENGCLIIGSNVIKEIKDDFIKLFKESENVSEHYKEGMGKSLKFEQLVLRLFAELL